MLLRKNYGDLRVNINGYLISGIQSFDAGYTLPNDIDLAYGYGTARSYNQNIIGNVLFSKLIVGQDNLFNLISGANFSGFLNYGGGLFGFNKAQINSLSVQADVGSKPSLSLDITAYGNVGSGVSGSNLTSPVTWNYVSIARGDISLSIDQQERTNRVTSFNYTINANRNPRYLLGENSPSYILTEWPVEIVSTFTIEIDNYQFQEISGAVCSPKEKDLLLTLRSCGSTGIVTSFYSPRAKLISENLSSNIGGNLSVNVSYRSYINGWKELER